MGRVVSEAVATGGPAPMFRRVYIIMCVALTAATLCLPVLIPVTFRLLGYDPALEDAYTPESFQAFRATGPLRRGFLYTILVLALIVSGVSVMALVRRLRGTRDVHLLVAAGTLIAGLALAFMLFVALITPTPVLCC